MSKGKAIDLQEWALVQSGAKEFLDTLPKFPKNGKYKAGIYVDYEIDEGELDDGFDWPDIGAAIVYAVLEDNGEEIYLGEIRAYNFETFWLSTREDDQVDTAENWFELIREDYKKLVKSKKPSKLKHEENLKLTKEESEALYKIIREHEENIPKTEEEIHFDYYDNYDELADKKTINSILNKIAILLPKEQKEEIDKDFLRQKYHTFNNEINERVYSIIEKAFDMLKTVEIKYFNTQSAEFSKRKIDVYYKSRRYVIGYCHLRKDIRKFRTHRITSAKLTSDNYKIPRGFDKNKY